MSHHRPTHRLSNTKTKKQGSAFVLALAVVVVMTLVVTAFSTRLDSHLRTETLRVDRRAAQAAAQAGLAYALPVLARAETNVATSTDEWFTLGQTGATEFVLGPASFRLQILDNNALADLNTADLEQLRRMNLAEDQIEALLDWREEQLQPRTQGAKDEFYNALPTPYNTRLQDFETIDEILLVRGFTPELLYQPPTEVSGNVLATGLSTEEQPALADLLTIGTRVPNTRADGSARVNANTAQIQQLTQAGLRPQAAQAIVQRRNTAGTFAGLAAILQTPGLNNQDVQAVLDNLTTTNENFLRGRLNLNTVTEPVLNTLPEITQDQIQAITGRQPNFATLGELATLPGFDTAALQRYADRFAVGTQSFTVRIQGRQRQATVLLEARVTVADGAANVVFQTIPRRADTLAHWGWAIDPDTETVILERDN